VAAGRDATPTTLPPMRYGAGDVVGGKFELLRECGGGGFGTVFRALDLIEDREVALKFLNHGGSVEEVRREFLPLRRWPDPVRSVHLL
jgi:serine/threonine protein kinase